MTTERKLDLPLSQHLLGIELKKTKQEDGTEAQEKRLQDINDIKVRIGQCDLEIGFASIFASPSLSVLSLVLGDNMNQSFRFMEENLKRWKAMKDTFQVQLEELLQSDAS